MARKRLLMELGMGTDLRGRDYTKAAVRGLKDALWHNSIALAPALGYPREAMDVEVNVGVAEPEAVDTDAVAAVLPYGRANVKVVTGGLDIPNEASGDTTIIANVAVIVHLDIEEASA